MSAALAEIREIFLSRLRDYLSVEQNRRDAQSALGSFLTFCVCLYAASHGMMPSYLMLDRPGQAIAVHFTPTADPTSVAELAQTRLQNAQEAPQTSMPPAPRSERPPPLESLSSMAASRPDYYGKQAILPPVRRDRPAVTDIPTQWNERPAPQQENAQRRSFGSASVAMPSPKIGTPTGKGEASSEISFDVPVTGGSKGSDFITLSSRTLPSSIGRPGGKELSSRQVLSKIMPAVPEWFERRGLDSVVSLRIVIAASGKVEYAEVEKTCGYKEMDVEAREAILKWLFEPTGFRESIIVKLNYRLR